MKTLEERLAALSPRQRALLELRRKQQGAKALDRGPQPRPRTGDDTFPLSFSQERLWFLDRLDPGNPAYNNGQRYELEGPLECASLERALGAVVARHESLRTGFEERGEHPVQRVLPVVSMTLPVIDLSGLPGAALEAESARLGRRLFARPFALERGPLLRSVLLRHGSQGEGPQRHGPQRHDWLVVIHHIVSDAWSMGIFVQEMMAGYTGGLRSRPPLPIQYGDYAAWQREVLAEGALAEQLTYWRQRLAGAPPLLELPLDRPRPARPSARGGSCTVHIPAEIAAGLRELARQRRTTLFTALAALFGVLLGERSGQSVVCLGHPVAGRPRVELEGLIGFFVNTLVLRVDLLDPDSVAKGEGAMDDPFGALLERLGRRMIEAQSHQDLPFERLVEALQPQRDLRYPPIFQALLTLQNVPRAMAVAASDEEGGGAAAAALQMRARPQALGSAKFDLALELLEGRGGRIHGRLDYAADLFDATTVERWVRGLVALAAAAVAARGAAAAGPAAPLFSWARRATLPAAERHQVVVEANADRITGAAGRDSEGDSTLFRAAFWEHVRRTPDAPAILGMVDAAGERAVAVSYGVLAASAGLLARRLAALGAGPEVAVAVLLPRRPAAVAALLGVWAAGACAVPLDATLPPARLRFLLEDSGARFLVVGPGGGEGLTGLDAPVAEGVEILEIEPPEPGARLPGPLPPAPPPAAAAYLAYTSGSTGRPKGVAVSYGAAARHIETLGARLALQGWDRVLGFAGFAFDPALEQIALTLAAGAALVLRGDAVPAPASFLRWLRDWEVSVANLPPAYWGQLAAAVAAEPELLRGTALRTVMVGGDALPASAVADWHRGVAAAGFPAGAAARPRLLNAYGPTETTVTACLGTLQEDSAVHIGGPLAGRAAYVLERTGARPGPLPLGVVGELYLGGTGVARGYHRRPALTAAHFLPDPFSDVPGGRLYRTGDRARWRAEGTLEILGRVDRQLKVRGFRVEPGEVEAALLQLPEIAEAVVVPRSRDAGGEIHLAAFLVAAPGSPANALGATAVRGRLLAEGSLMEAMLPTTVTVLERLPLLPSGKVDRGALPPEEESGASGAGSAAEGDRTPPRTPEGEWIATLFADLLGLPAGAVGIHADFFALGGHSLLATRLLARLRSQMGVEVPVRAFFEHPTVAGLERSVRAVRRCGLGDVVDVVDGLPPLVPLPRDAAGRPLVPAPLSFAQERLWFLHTLEPESWAYHLPTALRFRGPLGVAALEAAIQGVVARHETLRTVIQQPPGGDPAVHPWEPPAGRGLSLPVIDLTALGDGERATEAHRLARTEARRPFALGTAPPLRAVLLRLGPTEHGGLLTLHHIASDGWSEGVLVSEVTTLYQAHGKGTAAPLPELPVQYADFAAWQRVRLTGGTGGTGETLAAEVSHHRQRLAGAPAVAELPLDRPRPAVQGLAGGVKGRRLGKALTSALDGAAARGGATRFVLLLAAWTALLARWTGQGDWTLGTPVAGRSRPEVEDLIGFFVNTLVLRLDLRRLEGGIEAPFSALLAATREEALTAWEHADLPFEKLVEELQPQRSQAHTPLFQVAVVGQTVPRETLALGALQVEPFGAAAPAGAESGLGAAKFDLTLTLEGGTEGALQLSLEYRRELFEGTTAGRLLAGLETLLTGIAADPSAPLSRLPVLTPGQRHQLVVESNDTAFCHPTTEGETLTERLAAQVARTPQAVALVLPDGEGEATDDTADAATWSYRRLWGTAGAVATALRAHGVGPEVPVAVALERGPWLLPALLGVLRAGGAYLPLDPDYPTPRLAAMVEDSAPPVLLATRDLADRLPPLPTGTTVLWLDTVDLDADAEPVALPTRGENAAYILYTSGTTGRPKGVVNRHRGIVNRLLWMQRAYPLTAADAVLQKTPISFDVSVWELFWPLLVGARLVLARPGGHKEPGYLRQRIAAAAVTTVHFVPSMLEVFLETGGDLAAVGTALRRIVASGEALSPELAVRCRERLPEVALHNLYGPTEAAVDVTAWPCARLLETATGSLPTPLPPRLPIGAPIDNLAIHVVDRHHPALLPVPGGAAGELLIGGVGLARGYHRRPALTADRFRPDPFATTETAGGRVYRTGDLVRRRGDGLVEFVGRLDHQVKIRGVRIELGEVAAALRGLPGVREAVAVARPDATGAPVVVAYGVPEAADGATLGLDPAALRGALATLLPEAALPTVVVPLAALPLTPNGKIDRKALPDPALPREEYVAPQGPVEEVLAGLWSEVLGVERVGAEDDFFDLGGHSLLAMRLLGRLEETFRFEIPLGDLFRATTVARLAAVLEEREPQPGQVEKIARVLLRIRSMSDEEKRQRLARS